MIAVEKESGQNIDYDNQTKIDKYYEKELNIERMKSRIA